MCLALFSYFSNDKYPLIIAFNREEDIERETLPARMRKENDRFFIMGEDVKSGGTWLGLNSEGYLGFLTNHYGTDDVIGTKYHSKGELLGDYIRSSDEQSLFFRLENNRYRGLNIIFGNILNLKYFNNYTNSICNVEAGVHGLGNSNLDSEWPKISLGKKLFEETISDSLISSDKLFAIMQNSTEFNENDFSQGKCLGYNWEDFLDPIFIKKKIYSSYKGVWTTKSTTIIMVDSQNNVSFKERTYSSDSFSTVSIDMKINSSFLNNAQPIEKECILYNATD